MSILIVVAQYHHLDMRFVPAWYLLTFSEDVENLNQRPENLEHCDCLSQKNAPFYPLNRTPVTLSSFLQQSQAISDHKQARTHISEHCHPHSGVTGEGQH